MYPQGVLVELFGAACALHFIKLFSEICSPVNAWQCRGQHKGPPKGRIYVTAPHRG